MSLIYIFFAAFLVITIIVVTSLELYRLKLGKIPTIASSRIMAEAMVRELKRKIDAGELKQPFVIYDLGSGKGSLAAYVARHLPQATVIGYELSFFPYYYAVFMQKVVGPKNLSFRRANFLDVDLTDASAFITFVSQDCMVQVADKLKAATQRRIFWLSNYFHFPESFWLQPYYEEEIGLVYKRRMYAYKLG
ncbi:MAG: hypothetical protein GC136_06255 [Alphaproteobacteria bacterium]|nr:hypothetical protein [Alphaproteobacteria bacterium]